MVNSDFVNPIEKLLDLQWCIPAQENRRIAEIHPIGKLLPAIGAYYWRIEELLRSVQ
jgi:hypothetical protein